MAGHTDARIWIPFGFCGTISTSCDELDVVWEDFEGVEENFSKEAVTGRISLLLGNAFYLTFISILYV